MFTAYAAAKLANAAFTEAGVSTIPPQMVYNYTTARINKGKAPFIECVETKDGVRVTEAGLKQFIAARIQKKTTGSSDPEQLSLF